jgi:hypothetical protein
MPRSIYAVLYILVLIAFVVGVDFLFFRNRFWERLMVNIGIVLVFAAFYLRFLKWKRTANTDRVGLGWMSNWRRFRSRNRSFYGLKSVFWGQNERFTGQRRNLVRSATGKGRGEQAKISIGLYCRMICFAVAGFVIFGGAAWLPLHQMGAFMVEENPYAGPPAMMTCLVVGWIGFVLGALSSLIKIVLGRAAQAWH